MKLYRVGLTQTVYEGITIQVEAETPEGAELIAIEQTRDLDWNFIGVAGPAEIVSLEEVKPYAQP